MRKMREKAQAGKKALAAALAAPVEAEPAPAKQDSDKGDDDFKEAEDASEDIEQTGEQTTVEGEEPTPPEIARPQILAEVEEAQANEEFDDARETVPDPQAEFEEQLQKDEDDVKAELAKLGVEAAAAARADKEVEEKPPDPALEPPAPVRSDWDDAMKTMKRLVVDNKPPASDEEKMKLVHEALLERIEETKNLDDHKAVAIRRLAEATKERERCKGETQRALQAQNKVSASCRELQQQKSTIARENRQIAEEEQGRHTELKTKFEQAIKDVQEKMDAELEVRQHFLKENEELRGKLQKFTETYEAQEAQLAEQRTSRESEMVLAQKRFKEHESGSITSKVTAAALEKHNETLRKSQTTLRAELQSIVGKFDEFHDSVTGSNQRHGECKVEIDTLQERLQEAEKDNTDLKASQELATATEEHKVAEKQRDALDKLCSNLASENRKLQEKLKALQNSKGKK